jgi:hypothetical protein
MSETYAPNAVDRWSAGSDRTVNLPAGPVRTALLAAVRALGFHSTAEQYTVLEAERGSRLGSLSVTRTRVPVHLRVDLVGADAGTRVVVRLDDRLGAGRNSAAAAVYGDVFTEVLAGIDDALKRIDAESAASFGLWWRILPEHEVAAGQQAAGAAARFEAAVSRKTSRLLEGPRRRPESAVESAKLEAITFVAPESVARLSADVVDGMLTAGQLIAARPGKMPAPLVEQVRALVITLETRLGEVAQYGAYGELRIDVTTGDLPVVTFLFQQAAIRERLPVRILNTCTTCRLEKVINPDFLKLRERNRRLRALTNSVGAVIGAHRISPFILVGRLAQFQKTDPDFVCMRCQGTDADERPITFCPRCGERHDDSVLRICPRCKLDLRTLLPEREVWHAIEAAPEPTAAVVPLDQLPVEQMPVVHMPDPTGPIALDQMPVMQMPEPIAEPDPMDLPPTVAEAAVDQPVPAYDVLGPAPEPAAPPVAELWTPQPAPLIPEPMKEAGWYQDPAGRYEIRYWDGYAWTEHVASGGVAGIDVG